MVALHMEMLTNLVKDKRYELDYCNTCMLVAEADGVIFIGNSASCGCPATRFRDCFDFKLCYAIKTAFYRTGAMCNRVCGVNLGSGQHLLGTTKEWMILRTFTFSGCAGTWCAAEGCDKFPQIGCNEHCLSHAMQEQKDAFTRCAVEGCDKFLRTGCNGHCLSHATQEQKGAFSNEKIVCC